MENENRIALLIDADNISPKYLSIILNEAKTYGTVSIRRIYGDWTDGGKKSWKDQLLDNSIIPIQQYTYTTGKNSSDSAMIIDAMDILYSGSVDGFIIVSSDSDFTRLAVRLREAGMLVIGMGESKTPPAFVKSCEVFKVLDVLFRNTLTEQEQKEVLKTTHQNSGEVMDNEEAAPITSLSEIKKSMLHIVEEHSDESGKMLLSELGRLVAKQYSDFDVRNYGRYKKFSEFIRDLEDEFEIDMVYFDDEKKPPIPYVRVKKKK